MAGGDDGADSESPERRLINAFIEAHNLFHEPQGPRRETAEPGEASPQLQAFIQTTKAIMAYLPIAVPAAPRQVLRELHAALVDVAEGRSPPVFDVAKKGGRPGAPIGRALLLAELAAAVTLLIRGRVRQQEALRIAGDAGKVSSKYLLTWRKNLPEKSEEVRGYYDLILEHFVWEHFMHECQPIPPGWTASGVAGLTHIDAKQAGLRACSRIRRRRSPIVV